MTIQEKKVRLEGERKKWLEVFQRFSRAVAQGGGYSAQIKFDAQELSGITSFLAELEEVLYTDINIPSY